MTAYYNEHDPYAAQWLRNLIAVGHITPGDVDERSIEDVHPSDIDGYKQCHFFAGIGGWSRALRLAGWPDDRPVWTGSCPCQPFSAAGKRTGFIDERHLWPAWHHLISQRKPKIVFGEQVASNDGYAWLDLVQTDMEAAGYAFGPVVLPAAGIGAPHGRHRIFFVADAMQSRRAERRASARGGQTTGSGGDLWMADANLASHDRRSPSWEQPICEQREGGDDAVEHAESEQERISRLARQRRATSSGMAYTESNGREQFSHESPAGIQPAMVRQAEPWYGSGNMVSAPCSASASSATCGFWRAADWIFCRDGKWRPIEPGTSPLAHGISNRVGRLRAYGNAIVPQVAEAFIRAYVEVRCDS